MRQEEDTAGDTWAWMWKTKLPQRIKLFLWLVLHGKVLTNAERFRRNMSQNPHCAICLNEMEDLDHLLRRCPQAVGMWHALQAKGLYYLASDATCHQWVQLNMRGAHEDPDWPTKFMITVWYLWKWRCALSLGQSETIPSDKIGFLLNKFRKILYALQQDSQGPTSGKDNRSELWVR